MNTSTPSLRRPLGIFGSVGIPLLIACSSGPHASSIVDFCNQWWALPCHFAFTCPNADPDNYKSFYGTEANCAKRLQEDAQCQNSTCPAGQTMNASLVDECLAQVNAITCEEITTRTAPQNIPACVLGIQNSTEGFTGFCQ